MKFSARLMVGGMAGVLLAALGLQLHYALQPVRPTKPPHLAAALPTELTGFTVRDEPLGPNEYLQGAVAQALNYDEYVYRVYRRGDLELGVYIAYWGPGKMPTRDIASHTPDRCWTQNGMTCTATRYNAPVASGPVQLMMADWREFTAPSLRGPIWVYFWLLADREPYDYGGRFNSLLTPTEWLTSVWKNAIHGKREHYFFRLTSNQPFENVANDPAYQRLLQALAHIGLENRAPPIY